MTSDEFTIQETFLEVGDGHKLYVQDWGNNKSNVPIIYLHGGPGAGVNDSHKQLFEPLQQRVIFFDQRGAGKSLPKGSLENNTTKHLVDDIEKIAQHFKLSRLIITGGSWGSCLALAYGLLYPERVIAMVLRGIYTGSQAETDYLDNGTWRLFFPDVWDQYLQRTPKEHRAAPSRYHYNQIVSSDPKAVKASAYAYSELEGSLLALDDHHVPDKIEDFDPDAMRIELHYLGNGCFMPDRHIFENARKLVMPIWLVQGRYDMVCPPAAAYELHKKLPNSQLAWTTAGHTSGDRPTLDVMRAILLQLTMEN